MTETSHEQTSVRYFFTAGNGMETFLVDEVKKKLAAQNVLHLQGKVIFSSTASIDSVINIKSAERLFLLLKHDTPLKFPASVTQAKARSLLQAKLIAQNELKRIAVLWSRLQGELKDTATDCVAFPSPTPGAKRRKGSDGWSLEHLEKCDEEARSNSEQKRDSDSNCMGINEQEGKLDIKRKQPDYQDDHKNVDPSSSQLLPSGDQVSFRINCKCSGGLTRYFSTQDISKVLGASLTTVLGWRVDLKNPHVEISVNLTDDYCLLGFPLTKSPLANRSYIKTTGLRSTIAWAMASLAQIKPGSFVVDPMCGVGTILIEAAQENSDTFFLGIDNNDEQLVKAKGNVVYAHLEDRMQVLKASSLDLPLHSESVDAIMCDLPFGRKFGTKMDTANNIPLILSEMARVLRVGGTLVLLLSPQLSCLAKKILTQNIAKSNSTQEKEPQTGMLNCPSVAFTKQLFSQSCDYGTVPIQEPESHKCNRLPYLRHEQSFRVGLGAIDGLIHKYVKSGPC